VLYQEDVWTFSERRNCDLFFGREDVWVVMIIMFAFDVLEVGTTVVGVPEIKAH
jgi:hypothetical protein